MKIYVVGGAVRNILMGLPVNDMDYVVVGASVEQMLNAGYTQVGADFPVFLHPDTGDEYALARTERKSGKGYHGFTVNASPEVTLEEDLLRRDLTINAMAVDVEDWDYFVELLAGREHRVQEMRGLARHVTDVVGGCVDLQNALIRPCRLDTFIEDPLRVVRAARFAATYNMTWTQDMYIAAAQVVASGELEALPAARYAVEVDKVIKGCKTAGQLATFAMLMDVIGLLPGGAGHWASNFTSASTSWAAKVEALFQSQYELPPDAIKRLGVSNTLQHQIDTMAVIHKMQSVTTAPELCDCLYGLVDRLRRAPSGAGMEFITEWIEDGGPLADRIGVLIKRMDALFDEVRFQTHVDPSTPPRYVNRALKELRVSSLIATITKKPA